MRGRWAMGKELPDVVQPPQAPSPTAQAPSPTAQAPVPTDANAAILLPARLNMKTPVCTKKTKTTGKTCRYAHAHIRGAKPCDGQPSSSEHTLSHSSSSSDVSDEEGGRAVAPLLVPAVSDAMQVLCLRTDCTLMAPHAVPRHRMLTFAEVCGRMLTFADVC